MWAWLLRIVVAALLVGVPPSLAAERASACVCVAPPSFSEEVGTSDAVFAGRIVAVHLSQDRTQVIAEMEATRWWKGDRQQTVFLHSGGSADCVPWYDPGWQHLPLEDYVGKSYLVFADKRLGEFIPDVCGNTRAISDADRPLELAELGPGTAPIPGTSAARPAVWEEGLTFPFPAWATGVLAFVVLAMGGVGFLLVRSRREPTS